LARANPRLATPCAAYPSSSGLTAPALCLSIALFARRRLQLCSSPRRLFDAFNASRRQKRREEVRRTLAPAVVDFRRVWSDGGAFSGGEGVTAWRPVAPPGYAALGDALVRGFDPPPSALVVLDTGGGGGEGLGQPRGMPLVKAPRAYELAWSDGNPRAELRACMWRPVPHPGYLAMGCVVTIGEAPPRRGIKCLRADAAAPAPAPRAPLWAVKRADKSLPPLAVWTVDERLGTFVVEASERASPPAERWRLKLPEAGGGGGGGRGGSGDAAARRARQAHASQQGLGVNVLVRAGAVSLLLRDALGAPLLEVGASGVEAGVRGPSRQVVQAYMGVRLGVWAYHRALRHWEPVVEPFDVIGKCDANTGAATAAGIDPGVNLTVKSSSEMVHTTLAFSHAATLLAAHAEWRALRAARAAGAPGAGAAAGAAGGPGAGGDAGAVHSVVENRLGVGAAMELDFGDHT
jgi:vacuolar protein sorting-associated protein 13A/C